MDLTAIIACKDREVNLKHCLESIDRCTPRPKVIVVDFGSAIPVSEYAKDYAWLTTIRVTRNTKLFHKARALNIGLRNICTNFFCSTDTDQIFQPNFFGVVYRTLKRNPRTVVLCKSYFLKRHPKLEDAYPTTLKAARASTKKLHGEGCCTGLWTKWAYNVGGWDEGYIGYGAEDSDIILRAKFCKFSVEWVNKKTSTIHLPHPKIGEYYSANSYFTANKDRYNTRSIQKDIHVNKGVYWGQL